MRSCMPAIPKVCRAGFGLRRDSHAIVFDQQCHESPARSISIFTVLALACLATLCRASCTTR